MQVMKNSHDGCLLLLLLQVLKGSLSVHQPTIMCDGFVYEEGDDLDEDELEANAANLPKVLQGLPGNISRLQRYQAEALQLAAFAAAAGQCNTSTSCICQCSQVDAVDPAVQFW